MRILPRRGWIIRIFLNKIILIQSENFGMWKFSGETDEKVDGSQPTNAMNQQTDKKSFV